MKKYFCFEFIIVIFIIFGIKLSSILNNRDYYTEEFIKKTNIYVYGGSAPRGRILDRNGKVLVDNIGVKTIYYNKIKGITVKKELEIAKYLASIIDIDLASKRELKEYYLLTNNNGDSLISKEEYELLNLRKISKEDIYKLKMDRITDEMIGYSDETKKLAHIYALMNKGLVYGKKVIKEEVSDEEYARVLESNIAGVVGGVTWKRKYLYPDVLRSILGRVGFISYENKSYYINNDYSLSDIVGISYLEKEYEDTLKGVKSKYKVNSDYTLELVREEKRGNDLVLSIDIDLQIKLDEILKKRIRDGKNYRNTEYYKDSYAIVGDPLSGEILALSGIRLNDDGSFSDIGINTINKSFTVGSVVKAATIGVGYKYDLIQYNEVMNDDCIKLYSVPSKCSFKRLGRVNDIEALAYSSNYYQYMIAIRLTGNSYKYNMKLNATDKHFEVYRSMLASFGLGVKTGIDLPNEQVGIKGALVSDDLLLNLAIGQYDTYTPIQVLQYINSVATGKRISLSVTKKDNKVLNDTLVDLEDLERIREGLRLVLSKGTGKFYVPQGLNFAGKTGTSESFLDINDDNIVDVATLSSAFAGFYPYDNPKYSIVVITPNISHKNGLSEAFYYGASRITKDIVNYLESN